MDCLEENPNGRSNETDPRDEMLMGVNTSSARKFGFGCTQPKRSPVGERIGLMT